jgi:hypothetical protein
VNLNKNFLTSIDKDLLNTLSKLQFFLIWTNQLTSLHKTTFKNNPNLLELHLGANKFNALSNTMFSHLKNLNFLHLEYTHCINKIYKENASSRIAEIEHDLRNCAIAYLSLENDEIMAKLDALTDYKLRFKQ